MKFPSFIGYGECKVIKINEYVTIGTYKSLENNGKDMTYIYNNKDTNYILLYNTTIYNINTYNILELNKSIYNNPSPKGSPLKSERGCKKKKKELTKVLKGTITNKKRRKK